MKETIGTLTREEYIKKYGIVEDFNYCIANFAGVLEFDENSRSNIEKEAEVCQSEAFKLLQLCWKKKIINLSTNIAKKNISAIVDSTILMSELFSNESLLKTFDINNYDFEKLDYSSLMADLVKFNQVIEEYTKLMASDSPYITDFYMKKGFRNVFNLYHWFRSVTPILDKIPVKRILISKHMQLLWSNIGDLFATVIECKFIKDSREVYALVTEKHKTDNDFLCSLYYHICSEIFKQEDIITYFLKYSKFFLECLIDIMKLLINGEELGKVPAPREVRQNPFNNRYVERARPQREFDDNMISQVTNMGFSRRLALDALNRTHGNIEMAIEYLLTLPSHMLEEDNDEEVKNQASSQDANMENEEEKKDNEEKMDVDDSGIVVCSSEDLAKAIKQWLKMLFNWILKGFNSSLTDIDVENITQFILKYISTEEDVHVLMNTLIESMKEMHVFLTNTDKDISDINYQRQRKSCMKKASTLSKIISNLSKYFLKNLNFIVVLMTCLTNLFQEHTEKKMNFIPKEMEHNLNENVEVEAPKTEAEIFKDIIGNCINIVIAGYGYYKLGCSDDVKVAIEKELKIQEEVKGQPKKEESKDKKDDKKDEKPSRYDTSVTEYFKRIEAVKEEDKEDPEEFLVQWKEIFKEQDFLKLILLMIEYSTENFDECFSPKSFNKFLYFLLKLLEQKESVEMFVNENGFKNLLNLKSNKRKVIDNSKNYFINIVIRLVEDDSALLDITENIIKKSLFFKHDEEFSKEVKDKNRDTSIKKKPKQEKGDKSKSKEKEETKDKEKEEVKEEVKKEDTKEEAKETPSLKKSGSQDALKTEEKSLLPKAKLTKSSESTVLKKSDISFNTFKNCSGVRLNQFIDQMRFIETRANKIFLQACSNLCEIEKVKEYDVEMNVKSEYRIIKLKDSVLKDYIAKTTKESSANYKNQSSQQEKKEIGSQSQSKIGSQTARVKTSTGSSLTPHGKKDSFLISSLMNAQNFFPKPNRNIILMLMDKMIDKF